MISIEVILDDMRWQQITDVVLSIKSAVEHCISNQKIEYQGEICVLLCNDATSRQLNRQWRGLDKPTNVLSFPAADPKFGTIGDLAISFETSFEEAKGMEISIKNHLIHLVVHGTLHLLGYDHQNDEDAEKMENCEIQILKQFGIENPYVDSLPV